MPSLTKGQCIFWGSFLWVVASSPSARDGLGGQQGQAGGGGSWFPRLRDGSHGSGFVLGHGHCALVFM